MVKFLLHFSPKIVVKTIDDAEGTPGASRQYTRFNSIVKPKIEKLMNECKWKREDVYLNSKFADKFLFKGKLYNNGKLDPRTYIDENKLNNFKKEIENFQKQALESGDVEKFAKKALKIKSANILANVAISSLLLAVGLPKLTFILRKKITGSDAEPGLIQTA